MQEEGKKREGWILDRHERRMERGGETN